MVCLVSNSYGDQITFNQKEVRVKGNIQAVTLIDVNDDTLDDLLVFYTKFDPTGLLTNRFLSIFHYRQDGFVIGDSQTVTLNHGEIVFDIGDIDGDRIPEIVFLENTGASVRKFNDGLLASNPHLLIQTESLTHSHDPAAIRRYPFLHDIDEDTCLEIFVPASDRTRVFTCRDGSFHHSQTLWNGSRIQFDPRGALSYTTRFPEISVHDVNGDGRKDCLFIQQERLDVFLQNELSVDDPEDLTPPDLRYRFLIKNVNPSAFESISPSQLRLIPRDLNRDGYVDLVLVKAPHAALTKNISQVQIYMNHQGRFDDIPSQVLTTENISGDHIIADFNHDGRLDVGLLSFSMGFAQAARFLLTKRTSNAFELYTMRPDDTYPNKPDHRVSFARELRLDEIIAGSMCQSCSHDFTGDGSNDLVLGIDTRRLAVFEGGSTPYFSKRAVRIIDTAVSATHLTRDINLDGIGDILFWYPGKPEKTGLIFLIMSQRNDR